MQFKSLHLGSAIMLGMRTIVRYLTNMESVRVVFLRVFLFLIHFSFLYFGGVLNRIDRRLQMMSKRGRNY